MLLSIWLPQVSGGGDPARIAAQVVSGIGFLGAGAIIRLGIDVRGLTTAASLWLVAAIGMTIGAGMYVAALVASALTLSTLILLGRIERKIFPETRKRMLEIVYNHSHEPDTKIAVKILKSFRVRHQHISICSGHENQKKTKVRFLVSILETTNISKLAKTLKSSDNIKRVEIKEKY